MKIAGNLKISDWEMLMKDVKIDSSKNWDKVFCFFEKRYYTRYLQPINEILYMNLNNGEGFAVVNLQCSLIETIESFYNGWIYNFDLAKNPHARYYNRLIDEKNYAKKTTNLSIFESFFQNREPFKKTIDGKDFYQNVRCALLHETQLKNNWLIKENNSMPFYYKEGDCKIINRSKFQEAIKKSIEIYKNELLTTNNIELRQNYLAKFNHICSIS